jgi:hypothetical protein
MGMPRTRTIIMARNLFNLTMGFYDPETPVLDGTFAGGQQVE